MKKTIRFVLWCTFFVYCFTMLILLFLNHRGHWNGLTLSEYIRRFTNLVPFRTIGVFFIRAAKGTINFDIPIRNIFGNLLLFVPIGIYLPCLFRKLCKFGKFILCSLVILLVIEGLQLLLRRGSFDVDDLIMNMVGSIIGFGIIKIGFIRKFMNNFIY